MEERFLLVCGIYLFTYNFLPAIDCFIPFSKSDDILGKLMCNASGAVNLSIVFTVIKE